MSVQYPIFRIVFLFTSDLIFQLQMLLQRPLTLCTVGYRKFTNCFWEPFKDLYIKPCRGLCLLVLCTFSLSMEFVRLFQEKKKKICTLYRIKLAFIVLHNYHSILTLLQSSIPNFSLKKKKILSLMNF